MGFGGMFYKMLYGFCGAGMFYGFEACRMAFVGRFCGFSWHVLRVLEHAPWICEACPTFAWHVRLFFGRMFCGCCGMFYQHLQPRNTGKYQSLLGSLHSQRCASAQGPQACPGQGLFSTRHLGQSWTPRSLMPESGC